MLFANPLDRAACEVLAHFGVLAPHGALQPLGTHSGFSGARLWRVGTAMGDVCLRAWPFTQDPVHLDLIHVLMGLAWGRDKCILDADAQVSQLDLEIGAKKVELATLEQDRGRLGRDTGRMMLTIKDTVAAQSSAQERGRMTLMMRDMTRHLRGEPITK